MSYESVKHLKSAEFKRLCGVRPETFEAMMSVLRQAETDKLIGRPSKGSAKQVMMRCSSAQNTKLHQCDSLTIWKMRDCKLDCVKGHK
jgi:hypothetical protein